jgi:hypothetical protein
VILVAQTDVERRHLGYGAAVLLDVLCVFRDHAAARLNLVVRHDAHLVAGCYRIRGICCKD